MPPTTSKPARAKGPEFPFPLGRREHRKRETRGQLLAAGRRWFGEAGLYESRIEDMTKFAGVAKGTLYGYFPSKESLIEAVVQQAFSDLSEAVVPATLAGRNSSLRVQACIEAHFRFFEREPELLRILHQVRGLLKFNRPEGRPLRGHLERYLEALAASIAGPRGDRQKALQLARLAFGAASGAASTFASLGQPIPGVRESQALGRGVASLLISASGKRSR
ncbi:MAG: TetR/AcrR family transcriptional regulator [Candidatus Eisenbacteria bacterium]